MEFGIGSSSNIFLLEVPNLNIEKYVDLLEERVWPIISQLINISRILSIANFYEKVQNFGHQRLLTLWIFFMGSFVKSIVSIYRVHCLISVIESKKISIISIISYLTHYMFMTQRFLTFICNFRINGCRIKVFVSIEYYYLLQLCS